MAFQTAAGLCKLNTTELQRGMTIVELMVAIVVSSLVLFTVFYTWNHINAHIAKSKNRTQLEKETDRIGSQIIAQIRKSSEIISWNDSRIEFVNQNGTDTIIYYYTQENLLRNGDTVKTLIPDAKIKDFHLKNMNELQSENEKSTLLNLTLTIMNRASDTATTNYNVQINQNSKKSNSGENNWGF
jgi:prepilin-type N-terminal cleavage/methylation domain-containing protein